MNTDQTELALPTKESLLPKKYNAFYKSLIWRMSNATLQSRQVFFKVVCGE